jgi:hypothetical protein
MILILLIIILIILCSFLEIICKNFAILKFYEYQKSNYIIGGNKRLNTAKKLNTAKRLNTAKKLNTAKRLNTAKKLNTVNTAKKTNNEWDLNINTAKSLLDNEFKDLYNQEEKTFIINIVKQPQECILWNDFIDTMIYYIRPYNKDKLYYPEKIISTQCYFRKFLINRIQVLTKFYKPNSVILYYGAANSNFLPILINLFPTYIWHIYEDFDLSYQLESKQNIFLYKEKLTTEKAKLWKGKIDVFVSDYRRPVNENTILFKNDKIPLQKKVDKMMLEDVFINIDLIKLIAPKLGAAIKLKIPHVDPSSKQTLEIIKGNILWLPWTSHESTDGTLVIDHKEILHDIKMTLYLSVLQNAYCTHNRYYRPWGYYNIPDQLKIDTKKINGFCHCFDCVCELSTLYNYFKFVDSCDDLISDKIIGNSIN